MDGFKRALPLSMAMGALSGIVGYGSHELTIVILATGAIVALIIMVVLPTEGVRGYGLGSLIPLLLLALFSIVSGLPGYIYGLIAFLLSLVCKMCFDTAMVNQANYLKGMADARADLVFSTAQVQALFNVWDQAKPVRWDGNARRGEVTAKKAITLILGGATSGKKVNQAHGLYLRWESMRLEAQI